MEVVRWRIQRNPSRYENLYWRHNFNFSSLTYDFVWRRHHARHQLTLNSEKACETLCSLGAIEEKFAFKICKISVGQKRFFCKILSFWTHVARKLFNTSRLDSLGQLILPCPFNTQNKCFVAPSETVSLMWDKYQILYRKILPQGSGVTCSNATQRKRPLPKGEVFVMCVVTCLLSTILTQFSEWDRFLLFFSYGT